MTTPIPAAYAKLTLTFAQQVDLLQARGMVFDDPASAQQTLVGISYYRLSGYWYPFRRRNDQGHLTSNLVEGTSFQAVLQLYEFDRNLRLLVIDALERAEVAIRTAVTYELGTAFGAFGHENAANFHAQFDHARWIAKLHEETERSSDAFVCHFKVKYAGFPAMPIWMTTELISMGSLSMLYKGLKPDQKKAVSRRFGMHHKRLQDWLHVLTYVRNVCAHHSRLWNRELAIRPAAMNEDAWMAPLLPRTDRVFCILLMLRYLLAQTGNGESWRDACNTLLMPMADEARWRVAMGMPQHWRQHPIWN